MRRTDWAYVRHELVDLFRCPCHPDEYGMHVPPWGLELADLVYTLHARLDEHQERLDTMATTETQMLSDLDELLAGMQTLIAQGNQKGDPQKVIDDVEARIATARQALADPSGATPVQDGGTPPVASTSVTPTVDPAAGTPAVPVFSEAPAPGDPSTTVAPPTVNDPSAPSTGTATTTPTPDSTTTPTTPASDS